MRIDDELVRYLEALSKLRLEDAERETVLQDLGRILAYIDQLAELDVEGEGEAALGYGDLAATDAGGSGNGACAGAASGTAADGTEACEGETNDIEASGNVVSAIGANGNETSGNGTCAGAASIPTHATPAPADRMRDDIPRAGLARDALLAAAPRQKDGRIVAPKAVE